MADPVGFVSEVRAPRSLVKVNGSVVAGMEAWSWEGNSLFQADTFEVTFATSGLRESRDLSWFAQQTDLDVEILMGFPADPTRFGEADLESIFQGRADELNVSWGVGILSLTGRDRTADFIDHKTSDKFVNQTSSQIATLLAARRGLTPVVTATSTRVGKFYTKDHIRLEDDRTEWDLLTWLAREEGFVTYVDGNTLYFGPPGAVGATYRFAWWPPENGGPPSFNGNSLKTNRTLTVAKDIEVTVRSWNAKQKKGFVVKSTRKKKGAVRVQEYVRTIPNLTVDEAQKRADQIRDELSRHEMKIEIEGPADNLLKKNSQIVLVGTNTAFDQFYIPDTISRRFNLREGYRWSVRAKNHSPESEVSL